MRSNFTILSITSEVIVLKDLGPWTRYQTITNDADAVVEHLHKSKYICETTQIVYQDSEGEWCELCHDGLGNFTGFAIGTVTE
jgi:hypothetical protein